MVQRTVPYRLSYYIIDEVLDVVQIDFAIKAVHHYALSPTHVFH